MSFTDILTTAYSTYESLIITSVVCFILQAIVLFSVLQEVRDGSKDAKKFTYILISGMAHNVLHFLTCFSCLSYDNIKTTKCLFALITVALFAYTFFMSCYVFNELRKKSFIHENIDYVFAVICGFSGIIGFIGTIAEPSWFYIFSPDGSYEPTKAYNLLYIVMGICILFCLVLLISCRRYLSAKEFRYWIICISLTPVLLVLPITAVYLYQFGIAFSILLLYIEIDIERFHNMAKQEKNLAEMKTKLLVSQIQPHFMFNSLNTIYYLIGADPEKAQSALNYFSNYLRWNVNSLKNDKLVSIRDEMEHVNAYLYLEKIRFGDKIKIVYEENSMNFYLPCLSVQPLVENAIKHGLTKKKSGGTVTITTDEDENSYYVIIEDDGLGFTPDRNDSSGTHTGVYNVAARIQSMCSGTLKITSQSNVGTKCVISIPRGIISDTE